MNPKQLQNNPFLIRLMICMEKEPALSAASFALTIISFTLLIFLIQQIYFISKNMTQIEVAKFNYLKKQGKKLINKYNKGFIENWKEFLFPKIIKEHEPYEHKYEDGIIKIDGIIFEDKIKNN